MVKLISRTIYLELIWGNYSNVVKCVIIFYCKSNNNLQSHSNHDIVLNCNFRYLLDYDKYFMPSILNMAQYFPRYIEKSIQDFIHTDTECVSAVFSYALYTPVFIRIPPGYFISPIQLCFPQWKTLKNVPVNPQLVIFFMVYFLIIYVQV